MLLRTVADLLSGATFDINYTFGRAERTLLHIAAK